MIEDVIIFLGFVSLVSGLQLTNDLELYIWHDKVPYEIVETRSFSHTFSRTKSGCWSTPRPNDTNPKTGYEQVLFHLSCHEISQPFEMKYQYKIRHFTEILGTLKFSAQTTKGVTHVSINTNFSTYKGTQTYFLEAKVYAKNRTNGVCNLESSQWKELNSIQKNDYNYSAPQACIWILITGLKKMSEITTQNKDHVKMLDSVADCIFSSKIFYDNAFLMDGFQDYYNSFDFSTPKSWTTQMGPKLALKTAEYHGFTISIPCEDIQTQNQPSIAFFCKPNSPRVVNCCMMTKRRLFIILQWLSKEMYPNLGVSNLGLDR